MTNPAAQTPLRIDLGCGPHKQPGFVGVDSHPFPGVDICHDLRKPWPWENSTVDAAFASHFVEHLTAMERCHFVNELYRVLKPGASAKIIVPHWSSGRAYGDPTHAWPPVSEFWFYYLQAKWRQASAPHTSSDVLPGGYACDFEVTWGYHMNPEVTAKDDAGQRFAVMFYKEAAWDIVATLKKPG